MDSFEWNKIAGAVLFALLLGVGLRIGSETLFTREAPETPGYVIAAAQEGEGGEAEGAAAEPIAVLLDSADPGAGESAARKCVACHTFGEGEADKIGPNLWGVVMSPIAAAEGYEYSDALLAYAEDAGEWTFEHLSTFLTDPTSVVPGTKMAFPGLKDDAERADMIAYLRTLDADPVPLPEPEAPAEAADASGAEEAGAAEPGAAEAGAAEPAQEAEAAEADEAQEPAAGEEAAAADAGAQPAAEEQTAEAEGAEQPATEGEAAEAGQQAAAGEEAAGEEDVAEAEQAEPQPAEGEDVAEAQEPASEEQTAEAEAPAEEQVAQADQQAAMPAGDPAQGEAFAKRCLACHTFDAGGANKVGPYLWGVFNRPVASVPDFDYSDGMVEFSEEGTKEWDAETLGAYLADPRGVVPGTKMVFPGVTSEDDRANLIAYLATLQE